MGELSHSWDILLCIGNRQRATRVISCSLIFRLKNYWCQCLQNFLCSTYRVLKQRIENFMTPYSKGHNLGVQSVKFMIFCNNQNIYYSARWPLVFLDHHNGISEIVALCRGVYRLIGTVFQVSNVGHETWIFKYLIIGLNKRVIIYYTRFINMWRLQIFICFVLSTQWSL